MTRRTRRSVYWINGHTVSLSDTAVHDECAKSSHWMANAELTRARWWRWPYSIEIESA
jgi:hypothetical protein